MAIRLNYAPLVTVNHLDDILRWLKIGDYIMLYEAWKTTLHFHQCSGFQSNKGCFNYLKNHKVIYIDVTKNPSLLDSCNWPKSIKKEGYHECICGLKKRVLNLSNIPYKYFFQL